MRKNHERQTNLLPGTHSVAAEWKEWGHEGMGSSMKLPLKFPQVLSLRSVFLDCRFQTICAAGLELQCSVSGGAIRVERPLVVARIPGAGAPIEMQGGSGSSMKLPLDVKRTGIWYTGGVYLMVRLFSDNRTNPPPF